MKSRISPDALHALAVWASWVVGACISDEVKDAMGAHAVTRLYARFVCQCLYVISSLQEAHRPHEHVEVGHHCTASLALIVCAETTFTVNEILAEEDFVDACATSILTLRGGGLKIVTRGAPLDIHPDIASEQKGCTATEQDVVRRYTLDMCREVLRDIGIPHERCDPYFASQVADEGREADEARSCLIALSANAETWIHGLPHCEIPALVRWVLQYKREGESEERIAHRLRCLRRAEGGASARRSRSEVATKKESSARRRQHAPGAGCAATASSQSAGAPPWGEEGSSSSQRERKPKSEWAASSKRWRVEA